MTDPTTTLPLGLDPLSDTLHALRMQGTLYCRAELRAPWGIEIPDLDGLMGFLVVTSGRVWFEVGNTVARWLEPGSLTLIPHGVQHGGTGDQTRATYCVVQFDSQIARQFLTHLPETIFYQGWDQETDGWMESTLRYVTREAANLRPGGETVLTRLADILIIQAIRAWLDSAPEARQGWLAALRDPQIGRALAAIHRNPEMPWSVASIAKEAALSRSVFSARFTKLVGQSAMTYLTNWRMSAARSLLEETDLTVAMIAERVGYSSEPAFGRAFKRVHGIAPGLKRNAMRAG